MIEYINSSAKFLLAQFPYTADLAVILGTGLGGFEKYLDVIEIEIPYAEVPHFPTSTVQGHSGSIILGRIMGKAVIVLSGRFHYYEGYSMQEITFPIRVLKKIGVESLIITNVSGSVNPSFNQGDLVAIIDHINMMPDNALRGKNLDEFGPRFPDFSNVYSENMLRVAQDSAQKLGIQLNEGIYYALPGPNLETPAEYNMIHRMGADLVGMSTVPEVIVAKHMGMEILALSLVSNKCYPPDAIEKTTIEDVIAVAREKGKILSKLIYEIIPGISS